MSEVREQVREHYREVAIDVRDGGDGCCDSGCCGSKDQVWGAELYEAAERAELPDAAVLASLGCGNPTAVAELREGETVLDLGSGGGIDVLLSARRVGPTGHAYGLDMTDEMLDLARRNAADAGAENVEFLKGYIEDVPLPGRERRRDHLELRDQPVRRQGQGVRGDAARAPAGRADRDQRRRGVGRPHARRAGRAREPRRMHRRRALVRRVPLGARGCRVRARSRSSRPTRSPTGCTSAIVRARRP